MICTYRLKEMLWGVGSWQERAPCAPLCSYPACTARFPVWPALWCTSQDAADWPSGWWLGWPGQHRPVCHQSVEIAQELLRPFHEPAKGLYDIIGFSSGFPAVETPWSRRHWLEFKINWVSILFHMLRECLNVRLLRGGVQTMNMPFFNTQLPGRKGRAGRASRAKRAHRVGKQLTLWPFYRHRWILPKWKLSFPQGKANCLWILDCVLVRFIILFNFL